MLPSTGYFKTINCPFYEAGTCDRPYCHFKHPRREDGTGSGGATTGPVTVLPAVQRTTTTTTTTTTGQTDEESESGGSGGARSDSEALQRLVTEAVKKVLADHEDVEEDKLPGEDAVVSQVVEGLAKTNASDGSTRSVSEAGSHAALGGMPVSKPVPCVYNPTPIAELKKRHIPIVSYMPTRGSRVAAKQKSSPEGSKPWLNLGHDPGTNRANAEVVRYKPTAIFSTGGERDSVQSYVPTCKSDSSSSNSYEDGNSNDYLKLGDAYYPKSKKRREEYVPKKVKAPLKSASQLDTGSCFSSDFDLIDEIFASSQPTNRVPPSDDSRDSCYDMEPKFSDDEPNSEEAADSVETAVLELEQQPVEPEKQPTGEPTDRNETGDEDNKTASDRNRDKHSKRVESKPEKPSSRSDKDSERKSKEREEKRSRRNSEDAKKDRTSSERSGRKVSRSRSTSERSSKEKERHRHRSSSEKKRRSRSRERQKERSHDSHRKESSSSRKEKTRSDSKKEKEKEKEKSRSESRVSRSRDSKTSSSESRKEEKHRRQKSEKGHRSSSSRRSSVESSRKSKRKDAEEEKNFSDGSSTCVSNSKNAVEEDSEGVEDEDLLGGNIELLDDDVLSISDSDHDVQEECLKIFQEYQVTEQPKPANPKEPAKREEEFAEDVGKKKRVAHLSAATNVSRQLGPSQPVKKLVTPQQKMYERWRLMREAAAEKAAEKAKANAAAAAASDGFPVLPLANGAAKSHQTQSDAVAPSCNTELRLNGNESRSTDRVRIAHVPYARSLAMEKRKVAENKGAAGKTVDSKTIAQSTKSGVRVAHIPQVVPQLMRPEPLPAVTQKFPLNIRQCYLNIMHDACIQIYTNAEDAAQRALKEESACHERCKTLPVYKNLCLLATHRLRKEVDQPSPSEGTPVPSGSGMISHEAILAGKSKGSWSILKTKKSVIDLRGPALYGMLKKWILNEGSLKQNGYPRPHPDGQKGRAKVYVVDTRNQSPPSKVPNQRICARCGKAYTVDKQGFAVQPQNCIYHWGKKVGVPGGSKYICCQQFGWASGCCDAKTHVWEYTDYENLRGYVKTLPKEIPVEEQGVYALDCEMSYTTQGLDLTRITVVDQDCNVVYETLVKPQNPIIDYNTRFSGITEEHMEGVTTSLLDVQATLLTMFSDKTILVGHSLDSDLKALRLLHDTVVDTSVMFPHKKGLPYKRALRNLCAEYLGKIIQNDVGGHDSKEDAVSCMELILWRAKEDAKLQ